ncbi:MAG TPA: hypothetical protein ENK57_02175 [Polyangiaceae bacterium]|nr:hypothetical protein [Polyangiaceae bacterium]
MSLQSLLHEPSISAGTTSFSGLYGLRDRASFSVIVVSGALSISGTSSAEPTKVWEAPYVHESDATASGPEWELTEREDKREPEATRKAVAELRRISGLTWQQLGQMFEVSRRSVHFWASGKPLNSTNEERLMRVLDVVRVADRGSARATRAALLDASDGTTPFDMLVAQRFAEARAALGQGPGRAAPALAELSPAAKAEHRPLPPEELFDAKSERVHREPGRARAARTVRNKRRGSS